MPAPLTVLFMPEIGLRADQQLHRHRRPPAPAGPSGRVRGRGVVEGQAGAARLRGGPGRPRPSAAATTRRRTPGQFWKDFIRDTAPEFRKPTIEQLATFMQPTWQALIDGARYCEPQLREIIARQRARRHRRGQRGLLPGAGHRRRAVRAHRVLQPAGGARARRSRRPTPGLPADDRVGVGRVPRRVRPHPPARCGPTSTPGSASRARRPCPTWSSSTRRRDLNLYVYPEALDYTDAPAAGRARGTASTRACATTDAAVRAAGGAP